MQTGQTHNFTLFLDNCYTAFICVPDWLLDLYDATTLTRDMFNTSSDNFFREIECTEKQLTKQNKNLRVNYKQL